MYIHTYIYKECINIVYFYAILQLDAEWHHHILCLSLYSQQKTTECKWNEKKVNTILKTVISYQKNPVSLPPATYFQSGFMYIFYKQNWHVVQDPCGGKGETILCIPVMSHGAGASHNSDRTAALIFFLLLGKKNIYYRRSMYQLPLIKILFTF